MSIVDKAIFDALVKRQNVVLPGIGSLLVKRRGAKKMPNDRIIPPQNVVSFTIDELPDGESIVFLLTAAGDVGEKEAQTIYESWLEATRSDKNVDIKSVGTIKEGQFVIAQPLHIALNPVNKEEIIVMKKDNRGGPLWVWFLVGVILAAIALVLLSYFGNGFLGIQKKPKAPKIEIVAPVLEPVVEHPTSEEVIIETLKQSGEHRFHVIAGSFSIENNATNYIKTLQRQFPELKLEKLKNPKNGYWLVSIFNASTERQAYNKLNMYWDIDLDIWVYEENKP